MSVAARLSRSGPGRAEGAGPAGGRGRTTRRAFVGGALAVTGGAAGALAGCGAQADRTPGAPPPAHLSGPFDLLMQGGSWAVAVQEQAKALQAQHPQVQVNVVEGGSSAQLAEKIRATTAAGCRGAIVWTHS